MHSVVNCLDQNHTNFLSSSAIWCNHQVLWTYFGQTSGNSVFFGHIFTHKFMAVLCYLPVTVVEHKFLDESEDDELEDDPMKRRQFTSEATAAPLHHNERQVHERNADYRLIDDHHHDSLLQLSTIHLQDNMACWQVTTTGILQPRMHPVESGDRPPTAPSYIPI